MHQFIGDVMQKATSHLIFLAFYLIAAPIAGQQKNLDSVPLYENLGYYEPTVTTASPLAQQYFNQGMQLAYAFGRPQSVLSFREAQRHDPDCAMCYWGEAWALGPYFNAAMDAKAADAAYQAIKKAQDLAHLAENLERSLIESMAVRYAANPTSTDRTELDHAYADAMRDVVRRFPHDLDAGTLLAEALMVLRPWDLWTPEGQPQPGTEEALAVLESVLARNIKHPGACHLYIHAVEPSSEPARAEPCADHLADQIPGASHIQHMPSHIYMHIGRYGDGVRANQNAWQVDQQAEHGKAVAIYPAHNLHMLVYAGWVDGQSAVALQAAKDLAAISPPDAFYPLLMRVRFGRWDELLAIAQPQDPFHLGFWHFSQGMAHLRQGRPEEARDHLERLTTVIGTIPDTQTYGYFERRQTDLLSLAKGILAGELAASEGRYDYAVKVLEQALAVKQGFRYAEPKVWPIPVRQVLGAILLEADRPVDAEKVYREDLNEHPENGWALLGLTQSLQAQGGHEQAAESRSRFEQAWVRADIWLPASRF